MKIPTLLLVTCLLVIIMYLVFGLFFLNIPYVVPDEGWIISRAHFLAEHHRMGDPLFPMEFSPFFDAFFKAAPGSQLLGILSVAIQAVYVTLLPFNDIYSLRLASFTWSLIACGFTYMVARKIGLEKGIAFLAVTLSIAVPIFFSQIHTERPEIIVTAFYMLSIYSMFRILEMETGWKKNLALFLAGLGSWLIVVMVHPNAVGIPVSIGGIYLVRNYKRIFKPDVLILGFGLVLGMLYFYYLMQAPAIISKLNGGGNLMDIQGPPIVEKGIRSVLALPLTFYKKLSGYNGVTRPVSLIFFLISCISFFFLYRKKKQTVIYSRLDIIATAIVLPSIILMLFSGSNGKFLVTVFPLCAIIIAMAVGEQLQSSINFRRTHLYVLCTGIIVLFAFNFYGMKKQAGYFAGYLDARKEIREAIPDHSAVVMGANLYSIDFIAQPYYSFSGLNPYIGKPKQAFSEAVASVKADYLIVEDFSVFRLSSFRDKEWMDEMFSFLQTGCTLVKELHPENYVGFLVGEPGPFPGQWVNENARKNFITMIRIYKVNR